MMKNNPIARTTSAATNTSDSSTLIVKHIIILQMSMSGARTAIRMSIWYAFCTFVTSVVIRVIRLAVLNLSMLVNENSCTFLYMPSLRLQANPVDALAANLPAITPKKRLRKANTSMSPPYIYTLLMSCPLIPSSIILAVTNGMRISMKTSAAVNTGVSIESFLYSPT